MKLESYTVHQFLAETHYHIVLLFTQQSGVIAGAVKFYNNGRIMFKVWPTVEVSMDLNGTFGPEVPRVRRPYAEEQDCLVALAVLLAARAGLPIRVVADQVRDAHRLLSSELERRSI
jgi:hypothetical protein